MNDQKILEFIAAKQPVRAIQVADKLDASEREASEALRALVDVGDVVRTPGTGPNSLPAQFYTLSEAFRRSRPGQLILARMEAAAAALAVAVAAPVASPSPAPAPPAPAPTVAPVATAAPAATIPVFLAKAPPPSPADDPSLRRIERAIAHIKEYGPTSDADIRVVLNLRADQYPTSFIGRAVKDGRLAKDGRNWTLGAGTSPAPLKRQPAFGGPIGLVGSTPHVAKAPEIVAVAVKEVATSLVSQANPTKQQEQVMETKQIAGVAEQSRAKDATTPPAFRCGLWSDGVLELQRDGVQVAALTQVEGETVAAFMARMREQLQPA